MATQGTGECRPVSTIDACLRCNLPIVPTASEWQKQQGVVCVCGEKRSAAMPRAGATKPVETHLPPTRGSTPQTVVLPYPPALNHLYATTRDGRRILSKAGREYHKTVRSECRSFLPFRGEVRVTVYAYRPQRRGDIDGAFKALLDSLSGVLWNDDSQIIELHAYRRDNKDSPRVEVTVEEV